MTLSVSLLIACAIVALFLFRMISQREAASINELGRRKKELEAKYDHMLRQKWDAKSELDQKKKELQTLINNQDGLKIKKNVCPEITKEDEEQMISTYLLTSGKITLEQDHKIRRKRLLLRMDYLTAGVTLGFIDLQTGKQLKKGDWFAKC